MVTVNLELCHRDPFSFLSPITSTHLTDSVITSPRESSDWKASIVFEAKSLPYALSLSEVLSEQRQSKSNSSELGAENNWMNLRLFSLLGSADSRWLGGLSASDEEEEEAEEQEGREVLVVPLPSALRSEVMGMREMGLGDGDGDGVGREITVVLTSIGGVLTPVGGV